MGGFGNSARFGFSSLIPVEEVSIGIGVDNAVAPGKIGSGGKVEVRVIGTIPSLESSCADVDIGSNVVVVDCCSAAGDEGICCTRICCGSCDIWVVATSLKGIGSVVGVIVVVNGNCTVGAAVGAVLLATEMDKDVDVANVNSSGLVSSSIAVVTSLTASTADTVVVIGCGVSTGVSTTVVFGA